MSVIPASGGVAAALAAALAATPLAMVVGCGGHGAAPDAGMHIPDFSVCANTDAGPFTPDTVSTSSAKLFTATLVSVSTKPLVGAAVPTPVIGDSTFNVTFMDAGGAAPTGLMVTAEKPYMPIHMHGATVYPIVADQGGGAFVISNINFFMGGYWELTLDLKFPPMVMDAGVGDGGGADGAATADAGEDGSVDGTDAGPDDASVMHAPPPTTDKVVIPICVPN